MTKAKAKAKTDYTSEIDEAAAAMDTNVTEQEDATEAAEKATQAKVAELMSTRSDTLGAPDRRAWIEEQVQPLDIAEYVELGQVTQTIISNAHLQYVLRSPSSAEDMFTRYYIGKQTRRTKMTTDAKGKEIEVADPLTDFEYIGYSALLSVVIHLDSVNGRPLTQHYKVKKGFYPTVVVDEKLFEKKLEEVLSIPTTMVHDIAQNVDWFLMRVGLALTAGAVKNG